MKQHLVTTKYRAISFSSLLIGGTSLLLFFYFVVHGPFGILNLQLNNSTILLLDLTLCLAFFLQHSLMIRVSIREKIECLLPKGSFYAFFSIVSGSLLITLVFLWQETDWLVYSIPEPYKYASYAGTLLSLVGLTWAVLSLKEFDPFGRRQISDHLKNRKPKEQAFVLRGPYKITRHPFYFFILLMIWSYPVVTFDRFLFSALWTLWVMIGTVLEEKDLVRDIGQDYKKYQSEVPMLVPYKCWKLLS